MALAIAHRGDPQDHRENTIPALLAALEQGADLVEVDLKLTRDGQVILLHDPTLKRLWRHHGAVRSLSLDEVRAYCDVRYEIPTLDEALGVLSWSRSALMADLKDAEALDTTVAIVREHDAFDRVLFVGGDVHAMRRLRGLAPEARLGLTWEDPTPPDGVLEDIRAELFNPRWQLVDRGLVELMHERGYQVSTWTVDSPTNMARLLDLGVDAVITNRLGYLLELLEDRETAGWRVAC
ncbi:MAG: glycerophosphodiester phosphodiesterase [Streptosporangiaceae bacterium]